MFCLYQCVIFYKKFKDGNLISHTIFLLVILLIFIPGKFTFKFLKKKMLLKKIEIVY